MAVYNTRVNRVKCSKYSPSLDFLLIKHYRVLNHPFAYYFAGQLIRADDSFLDRSVQLLSMTKPSCLTVIKNISYVYCLTNEQILIIQCSQTQGHDSQQTSMEKSVPWPRLFLWNTPRGCVSWFHSPSLFVSYTEPDRPSYICRRAVHLTSCEYQI